MQNDIVRQPWQQHNLDDSLSLSFRLFAFVNILQKAITNGINVRDKLDKFVELKKHTIVGRPPKTEIAINKWQSQARVQTHLHSSEESKWKLLSPQENHKMNCTVYVRISTHPIGIYANSFSHLCALDIQNILSIFSFARRQPTCQSTAKQQKKWRNQHKAQSQENHRKKLLCTFSNWIVQFHFQLNTQLLNQSRD